MRALGSSLSASSLRELGCEALSTIVKSVDTPADRLNASAASRAALAVFQLTIAMSI